ncbi:MAG: lytic transglycosylase domain-containing protein [Desulfarculales bacterium]|nr:lytic transglycosylase domain-containing protein [Desulfarculales bacterium]
MARVYRIKLLIAFAACLTALLPACLAADNRQPQLVSAKVTSSSRVYLPVNSGQTIAAPREIADAYQLWSPLENYERSLTLPGMSSIAIMDDRLKSWLLDEDIPLMYGYLNRLTNKHRTGLHVRIHDRIKLYLPLITAALQSHGLPMELACLPLVESAFEIRSVSKAGSAGLWQLAPGTARRFGLTINHEVDERFDPVKSTDAASSYLKFLYGRFGSWPLALAAYNCGEGAMDKALHTTGSSTWQELSGKCRGLAESPLKPETLEYIPRFVAASLAINLNTSFLSLSAPDPEESAAVIDVLSLRGNYYEAAGQQQEQSPRQSRRIKP